MPRPTLLQLTLGGEWNINLIVDLPTLLIGQIVSINQQEAFSGEFDVFVEFLERGTTNIVHTTRLRLHSKLPQPIRIELDNELFGRYSGLEVRAIIKNCKDQVLFESGGVVKIHTGLNVKVNLPVVLTDKQNLVGLQSTVDESASMQLGLWRLSVTGVDADVKRIGGSVMDNTFNLQNN